MAIPKYTSHLQSIDSHNIIITSLHSNNSTSKGSNDNTVIPKSTPTTPHITNPAKDLNASVRFARRSWCINSPGVREGECLTREGLYRTNDVELNYKGYSNQTIIRLPKPNNRDQCSRTSECSSVVIHVPRNTNQPTTSTMNQSRCNVSCGTGTGRPVFTKTSEFTTN